MDEIAEDIKRLVPFLGREKVARIEAAYLLGNEGYRKKIKEMVDRIKAFAASDFSLREVPLLEPPPAVAHQGEIKLGKILYGKKEMYPLFFNKKDLLTHIGIFGSSGSGKTNIVHYLVKSLVDVRLPVLIFDFSKRNYRDLLTLPEMRGHITIYTVGRNVVPFRFNPLRPPEGVPITQWMKEFAEVFDHSYWLLGGGRHVVLKALNELYERFQPEYPRLTDVRDWLDKYASAPLSPREKNWLATARRPLESLCLRETGEIFECDEGIKPSSFFEAGKVTVLELDALSSDDKTFLIEIILQWLRDWLLASNVREKLIGAIVLEEAHHVLNREKTKKLGIEAVTDLIFREIRELGIGVVYVDQHPSLVSYPALGNTSTHIYMNLGLDTKHSSDVQDAASMLGLNKDKDIDYLRRLPTGHAFMLIRKSAFPNPFLVKFPLMIEERGKVSDEELKKLMEGMVLNRPEEKKKSFDAILVEEKVRKVSIAGWKILDALAYGRGVYTSELAKVLKMSCRTFRQEAEKLVSLGLVGRRQVKVYRQKALCYFLTHEGELALVLKNNRLVEDEVFENFKERLEEVLVEQGYKIIENNGLLVVEKNNIRMPIHPVNTSNLNRLFQTLKESFDQEMFFVCPSKRIENCLVQQAARYSLTHKQAFILFHTTIDGLNKFEKAEFS